MSQVVERPVLVNSIERGLSEAPVVALLGARQVGKTTLSRLISKNWHGPCTSFDLETSAAFEALSSAPEILLRDSKGLVIIDEIQRLPQLFATLRPICDDAHRQSQFLVLGSASLDVIKGASESLAGRIHFVNVSGLSLQEVGADRQSRLWMRGGFPRAYLASNDDAWFRWLDAFSQTFLNRDIPALTMHAPSTAMSRFWRMIAHFHGRTWNASEIGRALDQRERKVNEFRDLLAGSFMVRILEPWYENLGKRLVKSPKVYLRDSGILHYLLGIRSRNELPLHPSCGLSWEGFALEQTLIYHGSEEAYFYKTHRGTELDLLLLRFGHRWGFEFKFTDAPRTSKSMQVALKDLRLKHLWVVYPGDQKYPLTNSITALPLSLVPSIGLSVNGFVS